MSRDKRSVRQLRHGLWIFPVVLMAGGVWLAGKQARVQHRPAYTPQGYGGIVTQPDVPQASTSKDDRTETAADQALKLYNEGEYQRAEQVAKQAAQEAALQQNEQVQKDAAKARWVMAFSAARREDYRTARARFAELKEQAEGKRWTLEETPDPPSARSAQVAETRAESKDDAVPPARPISPTGQSLATLEEEAAYQHAVLTAALGDKAAAEAEFKEFMRRYPESPLIHAAIRRIGRMHGGNIPKDAEAVWAKAKDIALEREQLRERARSLCGPEVLAEILRRSDAPMAARLSVGELVQELAGQMKTDHRGTTLQALSDAAEKHGFSGKGYQLTWNGLWKLLHSPKLKNEEKPDYLVALVRPGHYVLIDNVTAGWVTVWDSSGTKSAAPGTRRYSKDEWLKAWDGIVLRLDRLPTSASR